MAKTKSNKPTKKEIKEKEVNIRKQVTNWIYLAYGLTFLPKSFFINLDKIYNGTYKNLSIPIPPEELLDMWKRKMDYLNKTADKNSRMGKEINEVCRIYYDLSILLSKYDSYKDWKEKQKMANEIIIEKTDKKIEQFCNNYNSNSNIKKNDDLDIASILDEI